MDVLERLAKEIYNGNDEGVVALTREALDAGMIAGMDAVGRDFRDGILFVPEVLIAARAMHAGMNILRPLLTEAESHSKGTVVLGTVRGDLHDIGKNLVGMMMEGAGFQVVDLGTDVPPEKFVEAARDHNAKIVGMSALLTTQRDRRPQGGGPAGVRQSDGGRRARHPALCRRDRGRRLRPQRLRRGGEGTGTPGRVGPPAMAA